MRRQDSDQEFNRGAAGEAHHNSSASNFGSARSDYGKNAYGGDLDNAGLERRGGTERRADISSVASRGDDSTSSPASTNNKATSLPRRISSSAWTNNGVALLLGGMGLGGTVAYLIGSRKQGSSARHSAPRSSSGSNDLMVKCGEVMTENPSCCLASDTVERAAQLMRMENVGPVPVISDYESRQLVGIATDRDLAIKVVADGRDPKGTKVSEVMSTGVATCRREDDLEKALRLMEEHQVRRIPVVDEGNRVVGIITQADVATRIDSPQQTSELVEEVSRASAAGA